MIESICDRVGDRFVVVVLIAELRNTMTGLLNLVSRHCDYDAKVVADLEALSGQTEDTFLAHQLFQEVHFIVEFGKSLNVDAHHQVHGSLWHDRSQSVHVLQHLKGHFSVVLEINSCIYY